jgi:hypothetical protein
VRGKRFGRVRSFRRASASALRARRGVFGVCGGNFDRRAAARAPTRNEDCGAITLAGGRTIGRLVAVRGVTCSGARSVAAAYDRNGRGPSGWRCFAAHNDPARLFSCGKGGLVGDVRNWPAALEVRAARPSPAASAAAARKPGVTTGAASAVTSSSATVAGTVNPNGRATSYHFDYGTTTGYGTATPEQSAGSGTADVDVSAELGGLSAATSYHYRLVATNCGGCPAGTVYGADATFTTAASYQNPVFSRFPDPMVLDSSGSHGDYYAYGTGNGFPIARSADLVHWQSADDPAFPDGPDPDTQPDRPSWVVQSGDYHPWAPSVLQVNAPARARARGPAMSCTRRGFRATLRRRPTASP